MHTTHLLGAGVFAAFAVWILLPVSPADPAIVPPPGASVMAPPPPPANGHFALVVEGDRDRLTITRAVAKADPWAGAPKGLVSRWSLAIAAADGTQLADVPLDLAHFDVAADRKGGPVHVEGCVVRDPRITMLQNVPAFPTAASYTFVRRDGAAATVIGSVTAARVAELTRGGR